MVKKESRVIILCTMDYISLITGIASIVLAIVSIVFSVLFYRWSDRSNREISEMTHKMDQKTEYLGKLFDKMFSSTFDLVRNQSEAMQHHIFESLGRFGENNIKNNDLEVYLAIQKSVQVTYNELADSTSLPINEVQSIVSRIERKGIVSVEGNTIRFIKQSVISEDASAS